MTGTTLLTGARLVLPDRVVEDGWLTVADGLITELGTGPAPGVGTDLTGRWVVPGFVDIHVHGGGGATYTTGDVEQVRQAAEFHRGHGTTTTMASLVTGDLAELHRTVTNLAELVEDGLLAGIHLEGPYLSHARCGAHQPDLLRHPDPAEIAGLLKAGGGTVRMVTLAPELPGALDSVRLLAEHGVIAAVGHTDADFQQVTAAIDAGARVATHLFNAMRPLHHREPGPIAALLGDDRVTVELIHDGVHLHPAMVELACTAAGHDRVALVTDAMSAAGMADGGYRLGQLAVQVSDGVARLADGPGAGSIAGSTLTMAEAFARTARLGSLELHQVARAASLTPARLLGLDDRIGSLTVGKRADLVVLDAEFAVVAVAKDGHWVSEGVGVPRSGVEGSGAAVSGVVVGSTMRRRCTASPSSSVVDPTAPDPST